MAARGTSSARYKVKGIGFYSTLAAADAVARCAGGTGTETAPKSVAASRGALRLAREAGVKSVSAATPASSPIARTRTKQS